LKTTNKGKQHDSASKQQDYPNDAADPAKDQVAETRRILQEMNDKADRAIDTRRFDPDDDKKIAIPLRPDHHSETSVCDISHSPPRRKVLGSIHWTRRCSEGDTCSGASSLRFSAVR
jgi:hypothetical protein